MAKPIKAKRTVTVGTIHMWSEKTGIVNKTVEIDGKYNNRRFKSMAKSIFPGYEIVGNVEGLEVKKLQYEMDNRAFFENAKVVEGEK